ncbi:hypothetical protein Ahy_A07g032600 [Arachis hypogaea]|uniref:Uncharacterized protein n=1 Tax=Arachis hypogaea TaxID=3818 RepID=A0A445C770_ARAHY|nr:hypothetical protein Ahy_A07g032600 [Arachis hypogaea]
MRGRERERRREKVGERKRSGRDGEKEREREQGERGGEKGRGGREREGEREEERENKPKFGHNPELSFGPSSFSSSSSVLSSLRYVAMPLLHALLSSQRRCFVASSPRYVAIKFRMDSINMVVVAQKQQEETSIEETANFVPDESFSRKTGERQSATIDYKFKETLLHYYKKIKLVNSRQSTAESFQRHGKNSSDVFLFDASHTRKLIFKFICIHEYPLSYVDHIAIRKMFASIRNTIKKNIFELYEVEKLNINKMMDANDSRVVITTDM